MFKSEINTLYPLSKLDTTHATFNSSGRHKSFENA